MSKYIIAIIVFITYSLTNAQEWKTASEPYTTSSLQDMSFINENEGWAVGGDGVIVHTKDGGYTWEVQVSNTTKDLVKVFFLDENNGWAGTGENNYGTTPGGSIVRTTDGGKNWTEIDFSSAVPNISFTYCDKIIFVNSQTGFMIAGKSKSSYLLKTIDGGLTWVKKDSLVSTSTLRWYDMDFYNESKGVVVGTAKNIEKYTTDGGETWNFSTTINDNFFKNLRAVKFISENEIVTLGEGAELSGVPTPIYKSFDGGATWVKKTQSPANSYSKIRGLYFKNNLEGIAVGSTSSSYPFVYKTTDGGETWTASQPNTGFAYFQVAGTGDNLIVLGYGGSYLKSTDMGANFSVIPVKDSAPIMSLQFVNSKGYAAQLYGTLLGSSDDGNTDWQNLSQTGFYNQKVLYFIDENTGFILKSNKTICKTTDGGLTWRTVLEPEIFSSKNDAVDMTFADANTGYASMTLNDNSEYHLFKTTDAGETWTDIYNQSALSGQLAFFDANNGIMGGGNVAIKMTNDGGVTWTPAVVNNVPAEYAKQDISDIEIINSNTAIMCGNYLLLKSTDKGNSWDFINIPSMGVDTSFKTISFNGDSLGYMATFYNGVIYKTNDGGENWTKDSTYADKFALYCSDFNNKGEIYFGTNNGTILKYQSSTVGVNEGNITVNNYKLEQNYPNPFNPSTTFSFSIAKQEKVTLKVYDILGKEVTTILNDDLTAGSHTVRFDASGLSSGVYFYTLKAGSYNSTQKMILMK